MNVDKRDFHVIHWLGNSKILITKLVNRRDAMPLKFYETKRNSMNLLAVEESLCLHNKRLLGKCNELFKKKKIQKSKCNSEISHAEDLVDILGREIM